MNECWDEGALRAYFDREMPPEEMTRIAVHVGACAECHTRYNELAGRAARVSSMMSALAVEPSGAPAAPLPGRRWLRPAVLSVAALAAAVALAFIVMPKQPARQQPVAAPRMERVHRPIQAEVTSPEPAAAAEKAPVKGSHARSPRPAKPAETEYYLALDDEPIDVGVVMRVALDSAAAVQADVIFDAEGRPRAIRPVKLTK